MHQPQQVRLQKLTALDEQIRVAMLGEPETRHDLLELRSRVLEEIRKITQPAV